MNENERKIKYRKITGVILHSLLSLSFYVQKVALILQHSAPLTSPVTAVYYSGTGTFARWLANAGGVGMGAGAGWAGPGVVLGRPRWS